MRSKFQTIDDVKSGKGERGAALVMALLVSFLLLVASAGLLLEAAFNTQNVTDATAEQQAYSAAESGIQSAINALRGNVLASPLIDTTSPATTQSTLNNKLNFIKALNLTTSNSSSDTSASPRLSRWVSYDSTCTERVVIGATTCDRNNGYGYSLSVRDPDNTGSIVSYTTSATIFDHDTGNPTQVTYPRSGGGPTTVITYTPATVTDVDMTGSPTVNFGTFTVTGSGGLSQAFNRFEIVVSMTKPYSAVRSIRGWIECNDTTVTGCTSPMKIIFDAQSYTLQGSVINLSLAGGVNQTIVGPPQRYGYEATLSGTLQVSGTMSSPEPTRLLLTSTGYGPRGASKTLQAIIQKDFFNGLSAPATLTLVGPQTVPAGSCQSPPCPDFTFNPGSSAVTVYTGDDMVSTDIIPPVGTTNADNLSTVEDSVAGNPPHPFNGTVVGSPTDISVETPWWLQSPSTLDTAVRQLYTTANASGRFFASGTQPSSFGNYTTGQGITFCDGDCTFTGDGGGILVVTGKLTLRGNFSFKGMIIVTGKYGVDRSGGGTGTIQGNMVISPYYGSRIEDGITPTSTATFLAPQYDMSGGGNSTIAYNSAAVAGGLVAVSNFVLGVVEK
jgi:hypothetical protein